MALVPVVALAAACHHAAGRPPVVTLITQPPTAFAAITATATATGDTVVLPAADAALAAPLPAAKTIVAPVPEPLSAYGLTAPVAVIHYTARPGGPAATLDVGAPTFDAHDFYVDRPGDRDVYLVLSDNLRPILTLVGIATPAPT